MIKVILIFLSSLILIDAQNSCSNYWQYVRDQNTIQGLLSFAHEPGKSEHLIKIVLSLGAKLPNVSMDWNSIIIIIILYYDDQMIFKIEES